MSKNSELRLQQECFMYFHNAYPELRGLYFRIKNENTNRISGAIGKATGIIPGVADSCLLAPDSKSHFIELKLENGKQSKNQLEWQRVIEKFNYNYHIIRSLEEFKQLCQRILG